MKVVDGKGTSLREKDCVWTEDKGEFVEDEGVVYQGEKENEQGDGDRRVADS